MGLALMALLLAACGDDPVAPPGPDEVPATVTPAQAWPGAVLTVEWDWLAGRAETPVFTVGDSSAQYVRADDRRVSVVVPQVAAGPATVTALVDGTPVPLGAVEVFGWARVDPLPWLAANRPWPSAAGTEMIGIDPDDGSLQVVDLATGAQRGTGPLPFSGNADEVGIGYRPGVAIALEHDDSACSSPQVWRIDPVPEQLDPIPYECPHQNLLELGPGRVLVHHNGDTWTSGFPTPWLDETGTGRIVPSPTWGQVLLFQGHNPLAGPNEVFVLDAEAGDTAYVLPDYRRLLHGAFTPDAAEAFLAVTAQEDPDEVTSVIRIDAATGAEHARTALPTGAAWTSVTVAVTGARVLVAFDDPDLGRWRVRVLRAADLSLEADIALPDPAVSGWWLNPVLLAAPDGSAAFLVTSTGTGAWRHRIDLLPE
jgi:hypothetical protein